MSVKSTASGYRNTASFALVFAVAATVASAEVGAGPADEEARRILDATGIKGGLIVHLGCGDGKLTAALHVNDGCLVHGLDADFARLVFYSTDAA